MRKCLLLLMVAVFAAGCNNTTRLTDVASPRVRQLDEIDDYWKVDPQLGEKVILYPVNRILDVFDLVSLNAGLGPDVQINLHATRALQLGGGGAATARAGFNYDRAVGVYRQKGWEASLLPFSWEGYSRTNVRSWGSIVDATHNANGMSEPGLPIYRDDIRDYWAFGGRVPLGLASVEADAHPNEAADLLLGFFTVDIRNDDLGPNTGEDRMLE